MDRFPHTGPGGSFTSPHSPPPYLEGHEATLHCDPGYTLPSTTRRTARVVTQHDDGTLAWEPHTLNCLPVSCGAPPDIPAHGYLTAQNFTFPHAFSYACEPGYRLEPPPPRPNVFYCGVTGHWTPALPLPTPVRCERVQCPPLAPPNGSVHLTDQFFFGSVATYRCNPPHVRVRGGEASRTCQADGQWSGGGGGEEEVVECGEVQCPPPLVVEELSRVVYASPQLQIIACNEGQQVVVKCLASGRWSKDPPYCPTTTQTKPPAAGGAAAAAAAAAAVGGTAAVEPGVKPMSVPVVLLFLVIGMIVWVLWIYYPWKGKEKKNK